MPGTIFIANHYRRRWRSLSSMPSECLSSRSYIWVKNTRQQLMLFRGEQLALLLMRGLSFVVGNNPHWVQDAEVYQGKLIVYSTGNFIFDQQFGQEVRTSVSLDVEITAPYTPALQQWLDLGSSCIAYQDDCLDQAIAQNLPRLNLDFNYDVVAGDLTGRLQTRANQQLQEWVEARLGWGQVLHRSRVAE